jgi:hypothetical protein
MERNLYEGVHYVPSRDEFRVLIPSGQKFRILDYFSTLHDALEALKQYKPITEKDSD